MRWTLTVKTVAVRTVYYGYNARGQQNPAHFDGTSGTDAMVNA